MSKLVELNNLNASNFMDLLRDSDVLVYENIQGSKIFFKFDEINLVMKQRSISNEPINRIDLALQKFYDKAFNYLESLDIRIKHLCPDDWYFCCQYFPDEQPAHIRYDRVPKNNLILTSIVKSGTFTFDINEINEYANLLGIDPQPILFSGKFSEKQLELINLFLHTGKDDIEYVFGEDESFSSFFYKILNPAKKNSMLMEEGNFHSYLDKLIIKIDTGTEISLAIINPLYNKTMDKGNFYKETYSIIINDFLEFLQGIDFKDLHFKGKFGDDIYMEIMSDLFNRYVEERGWRINNFEFDIPHFINDDKFRMNKDLVKDVKTRKLIDSSNRLEYVFKVILQSFRAKKDKIFGVFTKNTLKIFNDTVDEIEKSIDKALRIEREDALKKHNLLDFGSYYDLKYPKGDGEGKLYPDLYKKIGGDINTHNSKKKNTKGK